MAKVSVKDICEVCRQPIGEGKAMLVANVTLTKDGCYGYKPIDGCLRVKFNGSDKSKKLIHLGNCWNLYRDLY